MQMMAAAANVRFSGEAIWAWITRSFAEMQRKRPVRQLRVKETLSIGEKRQLLIVECGSRRMLIGVAGNFLTTLANLEACGAAESDERA